ncbi:histidine kinase [Actinoallomurus liliacearum]|uniref:histidine kinase n=1 Tax=Actinoallomurus liliacearum TaxID=1080073 RepID=A0ABP8TPY8_9ACTN
MISNWQRLVRDHPRAFTVAVALVMFAGSVPGGMLGRLRTTGPSVWWLAVPVTGVAAVAFLWHRSRPRVAVLLTALCAVAVAALGYLLTPLLIGPVMAALYSLAVRTDRRTARAYAFTVAVVLVGAALIAEHGYAHPIYFKIINPFALVMLPAVVGSSVRLRRAYLDSLRARAEHAERMREEEARHRVTEERMRIARELHDVVAHHLALANAQAGTAAHLARTRPDQAQRILADLTGTTSSALRELKATVGLLRQTGDPDAPMEPAPGLARLPDLVASFRSAGLTVTVVTEGDPRPLSAGVDLTAFRIVQEALTNVTKHAAAQAARVRLAYSRDRLTITVTDDGDATIPAAPGPAAGFGLIGMRERALSVGGLLLAGRRPEGGFEVTTELPLRPRDTEETRNR